MKNMIGCCGLDCEKCGAYLATVNNDEELRKQTAKQWSEWNQTEIPPEAVNCTGCRSEGVRTYYCDCMCEIRKCALGKGYETCRECVDRGDCQTLRTITDHDEDAAGRVK